MSRYFDLHATRNFGRKLNGVIEFIRYNSKPFGKAMLFIAGPVILVGSVLLTQFMNQTIMQSVQVASGMIQQETYSPMTFLSMFGGFIAIFIGSIILISTVYEYVKLYEERKSNQIEVIEVWNKVKTNMWGILLSFILFGVIVFVLYLISILFIGLMTMIHPVLTIIALLALIVGILFVMAYFMLVIFIQVYEAKGLSNAFKRATFLIKEHWWSTVAIIFVTSFLQSSISTIFVIPMYANIIIYSMHSMDTQVIQEPSIWFEIVNYLSLALYLVANYILYAIPLLGVAFQYFNLAEKKEAKGLMDKLDTFGVSDVSAEDEEHY